MSVSRDSKKTSIFFFKIKLKTTKAKFDSPNIFCLGNKCIGDRGASGQSVGQLLDRARSINTGGWEEGGGDRPGTRAGPSCVSPGAPPTTHHPLVPGAGVMRPN